MEAVLIRAGSAEGEPLHACWCRSCGLYLKPHNGRGRPRLYCSDECRPRENVWSTATRKQARPSDTEDSYVVYKTIIGKCSTDIEVIPVSLARRAN